MSTLQQFPKRCVQKTSQMKPLNMCNDGSLTIWETSMNCPWLTVLLVITDCQHLNPLNQQSGTIPLKQQPVMKYHKLHHPDAHHIYGWQKQTRQHKPCHLQTGRRQRAVLALLREWQRRKLLIYLLECLRMVVELVARLECAPPDVTGEVHIFHIEYRARHLPRPDLGSDPAIRVESMLYRMRCYLHYRGGGMDSGIYLI